MGLYNLDGEQFAKSIPMVLSSYGIFATYFTRIPGSALEKGGRMSKSSFDAGGIKLASTSSKGIVFGQTTPYTCASCALQMRLDDLGVVLPEAKIASALNTTTNGTKILDIPSAINKMGLEGVRSSASIMTFDDLLKVTSKGEPVIAGVNVSGLGPMRC